MMELQPQPRGLLPSSWTSPLANPTTLALASLLIRALITLDLSPSSPGWPPSTPGLKQRPEQMAKAGFFYEGVSDQVKCFSCDGGLGSWEEGDSPEEEHAKWFPGCTYLQLTYNPVKASDPLTNPSNTECARALKKEDTIGSKVVSLEELSEDKDEELRREIQQLRDERSCKICLEKEASIVFLPCGHLSCCSTCAPSLTKCPVCRARIDALVRAFLT